MAFESRTQRDTGGQHRRQLLHITASNGATPNAIQNFTLMIVASEAPAITSAATKILTVGTASSLTVTDTGFRAPTFSETGRLPADVTFASAGVLSGAASTVGIHPITITASNGVTRNATQKFTRVR